MEPSCTLWYFRGVFWTLLVAGAIESSYSQGFPDDQGFPPCELLIIVEEAAIVNPPGFNSISTGGVNEEDGEVRVLFFHNQEAPLAQFVLQAWGITDGVLVEPIGAWLPPEDPSFLLSGCGKANDTVALSPSQTAPQPGVNVFMWSAGSRDYCNLVFRANGLSIGGQVVEYRSEIVTRYACQNGGTCVTDGQTFSCRCHPTYSGARCQNYDDTDTQFSDSICECPLRGTAGANCEIDPCDSNPCGYGGECEFLDGFARCTCRDGYSGPLCQLVPEGACSSQPCLNAGTCLQSYSTYFCVCPNTYTGLNCEVQAQTNCSSQPCLNGGTCLPIPDTDIGYACTCPSTFTGSNCEIQSRDECASNPCLAGSTCYDQINGFTCFCANGRHGTKCQFELEVCDDNPCSNGGICYTRPGAPCKCFTNSTSNQTGCDISPTCDITNLLYCLSEIEVDDTNVEVVAVALANATSNYNRIGPDGLALTATVLENIVRLKSPSISVTGNVITTVDSILNLPDDTFAGSYSAARILESFETQLTFVQEDLERVDGNVAVQVVFLPNGTEDYLSYGSFPRNGAVDDTLQNNEGILFSGREDIPRDRAEALISVPDEAIEQVFQMDARANLPVIFTVYLTPRLFQLETPGPYVLPDGGQLLVNSRVISASIAGKEETVRNLMSPVITSFLPTNDSLSNEPICVFWDVASSNWSTEGCSRSMDDFGDGVVACNCNHLTSFAILVSYYGDINDFALDIISIVGCAISIAALLLTVVTCLVSRELRDNPAKKTLINLCLSLLGLYAVFLAGINRAEAPVTCVVMAALIQYFFLTSVCWASAEAMNLFYLLVITQRVLLTKYLVKLMIFCWGVPAVVVVFTHLMPYMATGQWEFMHNYCFLPPGSALYFGVLLPVGLLLLFNLFIFALLLRRLICQRVESSVTRAETKVDAAIRHARIMLPVSVVLGATWLFGFLAIEEAAPTFQWIFTILNAFLGLVIFLMFIVAKKKGRKGLRMLFCIEKLRSVSSSHSSHLT